MQTLDIRFPIIYLLNELASKSTLAEKQGGKNFFNEQLSFF